MIDLRMIPVPKTTIVATLAPLDAGEPRPPREPVEPLGADWLPGEAQVVLETAGHAIRETAGRLTLARADDRNKLRARRRSRDSALRGVRYGRDPHAGSKLLSVELARRWAAQGLARIRADIPVDRLRDNGISVTVALSSIEHLLAELTSAPTKVPRWPSFNVVRLPTWDHMFRALWLGTKEIELLDRDSQRALRKHRIEAPRSLNAPQAAVPTTGNAGFASVVRARSSVDAL